MKQGKIYFYNPCGERPAEMKKIERRWRLDHFHTSIVQYGYWLMLGDGCSHHDFHLRNTTETGYS